LAAARVYGEVLAVKILFVATQTGIWNEPFFQYTAGAGVAVIYIILILLFQLDQGDD
tara:strand:- start:801 stop:971 length:171 start_codon:yes stop_codon:yes gene_type:complete